jgi:hypothetical protein
MKSLKNRKTERRAIEIATTTKSKNTENHQKERRNKTPCHKQNAVTTKERPL